MKTCLLSVAVMVIAALFNFANAKTLRVGYNGTALAGVDYADFNSAHTAAAVGDTIQIYGSQSGTSTKRLVIQGFGYNLDVHPTLSATGLDIPSYLNINLSAGSDSSVIEGLTLYSSNVKASKLVIRRCTVDLFYMYNNDVSIDDIKMIDCVVNNCQMIYNTGFECKNLVIYNSIINGYIYMYKPGSSGAIVNCVNTPPTIWGGNSLQLNDAGFLVKNCILGYYNTATPNTVYERNLFYNAVPSTLPLGNNNQWGLSWANIFQRLGGTDDNVGYASSALFNEDYYQLKAGSPAIGAGTDAANAITNCGIFGGEAAYVYKLGGIPAIPSIYKLTAPSLSTSGNPYNVTISVRSNN